MGLDVNRVFSHELQDVFYPCRVREAAEANAVASGAGRRKEGRAREDGDRYHG